MRKASPQLHAIRAAFLRIKQSSPMHERGQTWRPPEAGLLWAVWMQAVIDHLDLTHYRVSKPDRQTAEKTALTGFIVKPDETEVNALELLGIDPQWAYAQIMRAFDYREVA